MVVNPEDRFSQDVAHLMFSQETETGLYVCLNTFLGFGKRHVEKYFRKTGNGVFLHIHRTRKEVGWKNEIGQKYF